MKKVCQTLKSNSQEAGSSSNEFCGKPSCFLFFLEFRHAIQATSAVENSMTNIEKRYWTTVKFSPAESSLDIFVKLEDKRLFLSNVVNNLDLLNSTLQIYYNYWDYESHTFSIDEINFIEGPLTTCNCVSGVVNAMHLFSLMYGEMSNEIQHFIRNIKPQALLDGLHEVLLYACGHRKVKTTYIKRKRSGSDVKSNKKWRPMTDDK